MNRSFRRVWTGTAVVHLALVALFLVVQIFLLGARPLKLKEEITMVDLSGAAGGGGEPGPVTPPEPAPKPPPKIEPVDVPPPEPAHDVIAEPVKPKPPKVKPKPKPTPQVKAPTPPRTNQVAKAKAPRPRMSAAQIRDLLNGAAHTVGSAPSGVRGRTSRGGSLGVGNGFGPGTGAGGADSPVAWYYAMVKQIMYEAWQQPSGLANAGNPTATVTIRVRRDGTITDWQMTRPSGNALLDDSVRRAVQAVKRLKPLPAQFIGPARDIEIEFELEKLLM